MKSLLFSLLAVSVTAGACAQSGISARTQLFLHKYASLPERESQARLPGYLYRVDANGGNVLPALLLMEPGANGEDLERLGVRIGTRAGNVWTASIPPARLRNVTVLKSVKYVELDEPLIPTMDSARRTTRVDSAHAGWGLPKGFSGKGVVIGVLDVGFDYTHPAFWDTAGTQYRVRRVWEQRGTGTPPSGFGYGRELTDSTLIQAAGTDNAGQSHGAHVAGIATGSGLGSGDTAAGRYRGMAFSSDVVLVGITPPAGDWLSTGMTDIINGMKYVYDYAGSVGKPAVVNLSWGCTTGSHDGRSLFSQACDALTGPGKIFVLSAGNNGTNNLHIQKAFVAADTSISTFVNFPLTPAGKRSWFDVWGDSAQSLSVQLSLYNGSTRTDVSSWIPLGSTQTVYLRGLAGDTLQAAVSTGVAAFNNKPRVLLDLESRTADRLCISVRGTAGTVNGWLGYVYSSTGYYGDLNNGGVSWAVNGNAAYLVSDMASSRSAIAVGAYASKNVFFNLANVRQDYTGYVSRGRLVPFSSKGPTADGRVKPDITGPGLWLSSSVNSFDASFGAGGSDRDNVVAEWTKPGQVRPYQYAALTGTSMSSPAVAGITALLLEAAPGLTPDSMSRLLAATAIQEPFMNVLPNSNWGAGKVNAYAAIQRVLSSLGISEVTGNPSSLDVLIYPNPSSGAVTLEHRADRGGTVAITVSDMFGKVLSREIRALSAGSNSFVLSRSGMPAGIYFVRIETAAGSAGMKVILK